LAPTALGARVRLEKGRITIIDGPFTEAKEILGGYAQFELGSKQEAIDAAVKFMELHRLHWPGWEGETEIRQMCAAEEGPCPAEAAQAVRQRELERAATAQHKK
jgi:hypothetical protein